MGNSREYEKRIYRVLEKYTRYKKVIVVSHGMLMRTIRDQAEIAYAGIIEYCTK